jgi:hypothetical protein
MPHIATITRKYTSPLLPCSAARPRYPTAPPLPANAPGHSCHPALGLRCPTAPRLPANVPGHSCHVPPLGLRCPTAPRLPANVPGHSCHVLPLGLRCPTAPRLPANVPMYLALPPRFAARAARPHGATITRQCSSYSCHVLPLGPRCSTAPRLPAMCLATPAVVCRSCCDAPRRHDYPPMCLALPPCFAARAAMPPAPRLPANAPGHSCHVPPLGLRCPTVPRLPANVPGTPAMFRRSGCDAPRRHYDPQICLALPLWFADRIPMLHGATITRQCARHSRHVPPFGLRCSTAPR